MSKYKQKFIVVMESGEIVKATVFGENYKEGEYLAIEYAQNETGVKFWDVANAPVINEDNNE